MESQRTRSTTRRRGAVRILEALPTAVVVLGKSERVRFANDRAANIFGTTRKELEGRTIPPALQAAVKAASLTDGSGRSECVVRLGNGRTKTLGFSLSTSDDDTIIVLQDISRVMQQREERDKLMSLAAIGEALPSLLHELKNPLAAITAAVEVLLEEVDPGYVMDQLHAVLSEVRRMKLGFEGIGAVHGKLRSERFSPIDYALREACRVLSPRIENAQITFRCDIKDLPLLPLDPAMARAIVFNFVTNALHACEAGDTITLHAQLEDDDRAFTIVVVDTGTGMSPEVLDRATDLFFTTKPSGSGIGLALCSRAVKDAGGEMTLRSVPGFGTSVSVKIPVNQEAR